MRHSAPRLAFAAVATAAAAAAAAALGIACREKAPGDAGAVVGVSPPSASPAERFGPAVVVATPAQRAESGFRYGWGDGTLGAIRSGGSTVFFASGKTAAACAGAPDTQATFRVLAAPDDPSRIVRADCAPVFAPQPRGARPADRLRGAFDRDYAGGGPVLRVKGPSGQAGILLAYHGEVWSGASCSYPCFYGALGLALSVDEGASFERVGEIVQPTPSRAAWLTEHAGDSLPIGTGGWAVGDEARRPLDPTRADPASSYLYVFFVDLDPRSACGPAPCLTVARARLSEVVAVAFAKDARAAPRLFRKLEGGAFTEPAASGDPDDALPSGRFSPVLRQAFMPSVLYDRALDAAVLATVRGHALEVRVSRDLAQWPVEPLALLDERPRLELRYPSLVGEGDDPAVGGASPWVFALESPPGFKWPESTIVARRMALGP